MSEAANFSADKDTTHPAILSLKSLLEKREITPEIYKKYLYLFEKLNRAFLISCDQEKFVSRKTSELNRKLKEQKRMIESVVEEQQSSRATINELRQMVTNIQFEIDSNQNSIEEITRNTNLKTIELDKIQQKIEKNQQEIESRVSVEQSQLIKENADLFKLIENKKREIQGYIDKNKAQVAKIEEMKETLLTIEENKKVSSKKLTEVRLIPDRIRIKTDEVSQKCLHLLKQEKDANKAYSELGEELTKQDAIIENNKKELETLNNTIDSNMKDIVNMRIQSNDIAGQIKNLKDKRSSLMLDKIQLEKEIKSEQYEISLGKEKENKLNFKIGTLEKQCVSFEEAITRASQDKNILEKQAYNMKMEAKEDANYNKQFAKTLDDLAKKNEDLTKKILSSTNISKDLSKKITETIKVFYEKQAQRDKLIRDERDLNLMLTETGVIRDRKAREYTQMIKKASDVKALAQERYLDFLDLCKKAEQISANQADIMALYETVKADRNKFVTALQGSSQQIYETREKIKIIEAEGSVLASQLTKTEIDVKKLKYDLINAYKKKEKALDNLGSAMRTFKECEQKIDAQVAETNRMSRILRSLESQIIAQQLRYKVRSEDCMDKSRMLIDKQDELCILNEQLNQNEDILQQGEKIIKQRDEDIKLLRLQLSDFERNIELMGRKIPELKKCDEEIKELKWQIKNVEKETKEFEKKLEDPKCQARKRNYTGADIPMEKLNKKIAFYEQRISEKNQQIWEAQVLYNDIKEKNEKVKAQLKAIRRNRKKTTKESKAKADLMYIQRKTKAAKSELAVMAATKMELQERKQQVEEEKIDSARRVKKGEAFDEYADKMIRMHERDELIKTTSRKEWFDEEEEEPHGRQKYDAYPTADGLSRPYGGFPVFQPQKKSGNLRFYRREKEREIKL